jgi:acetyl-CoA carboxylase biotin carboxylase subunit
MFKKILIANRGEIAVRVMHACGELGIQSVAVYSDADVQALHARVADEAFHLGGAPATESYLNIEKVIAIAGACGAEAIHPGYGFLAENWQFAKACEEAGITFIGPPWKAMKLLGNKLESRRTMMDAGVPVIPGMITRGTSPEEMLSEAKRIGFPVLVKAAAGGGGKGMRVVGEEKDLQESVEGARREAKSAFGDDTVYIEKYLVKPRHIEFQVLGDKRGNVLHLNERECSIQRRHQKIVEESPSPVMDPDLRRRMGEAAVQAIKSSGYFNAGTVEFLVDASKNFYFLEVNARLQVEHPVTELVAGVDLVHEQIRIAAGDTLTTNQDDVSQKGHAIEVRLYAEDAENDFLPSSGTILFQQEPKGPGIRVDTGIYSGCEVSVYYDPILAKLIVWAPDRDRAISRMKYALDNYPILGVQTTGSFLKAIMNNPTFQAGDLTTDFLERESAYFEEWKCDRHGSGEALAAAAAFLSSRKASPRYAETASAISPSPWNTLGDWSIGSKH